MAYQPLKTEITAIATRLSTIRPLLTRAAQRVRDTATKSGRVPVTDCDKPMYPDVAVTTIFHPANYRVAQYVNCVLPSRAYTRLIINWAPLYQRIIKLHRDPSAAHVSAAHFTALLIPMLFEHIIADSAVRAFYITKAFSDFTLQLAIERKQLKRAREEEAAQQESTSAAAAASAAAEAAVRAADLDTWTCIWCTEENQDSEQCVECGGVRESDRKRHKITFDGQEVTTATTSTLFA